MLLLPCITLKLFVIEHFPAIHQGNNMKCNVAYNVEYSVCLLDFIHELCLSISPLCLSAVV